MTIIRKGVPEDAEAVAKVHASSWRTTYHEIVDEEFLNNFVWEKRHDKWKKMLQDDHTKVVLVVESKGHVVGFLAGGAIKDPKEHYEAELYAMYILKEYRGGQIGTKLFLRFVDWLKQEKYKSLFVWVAEKNVHQRFYQKLGAKIVGFKDVHRAGLTDIHVISYAWEDINTIMPDPLPHL